MAIRCGFTLVLRVYSVTKQDLSFVCYLLKTLFTHVLSANYDNKVSFTLSKYKRFFYIEINTETVVQDATKVQLSD